ncbi:MAG: DUF6585 family protein [Anaerolineae bacterium]
MRNSLPYHYKPQVSRFFTVLFLSIPFGCFYSLVIGLVISFLLDKFTPWKFGAFPFFMLLSALIIIRVINANWYTNFEISKDSLKWKTLFGNTLQFKPFDINNAVWQKDKIVINKKYKIHLSRLPLKQRLEISTILAEWIPKDAGTFEMQQFRNWKQNLPNENNINDCSAETNRQKITVLRRIYTIILAVFALGIIWAALSEPIDDILLIVLFFSGFISFGFLILFVSTRYRRIFVNKEGIIYQRGKQEIVFNWEQIEVMAINPKGERILIWPGKRYQSFSYAGMNLDDVNQVLNAIYLGSMAHKIPFGIVEGT